MIGEEGTGSTSIFLGIGLGWSTGATGLAAVDDAGAAGFGLFVQHLESIPELRCAHLAWLWHHRPGTLQVYGSVEDGYLVAPPPPLRRPKRPERGGAATVPALVSFQRVVRGRPSGYSAGANEQQWKAAVRSAFSGCNLPAGCRVQVELEFLLSHDQLGRNEPDLDNLIKAAIDALDGVEAPRGHRRGPRRPHHGGRNRDVTASHRGVTETTPRSDGAHVRVPGACPRGGMVGRPAPTAAGEDA